MMVDCVFGWWTIDFSWTTLSLKGIVDKLHCLTLAVVGKSSHLTVVICFEPNEFVSGSIHIVLNMKMMLWFDEPVSESSANIRSHDTQHQQLAAWFSLNSTIIIGVNVQLGSWHWRSQSHRCCCICPGIQSQLHANKTKILLESQWHAMAKPVTIGIMNQLSPWQHNTPQWQQIQLNASSSPLWQLSSQQNLRIEAATLGQHCQLPHCQMFNDIDWLIFYFLTIDVNDINLNLSSIFSKTLTFNILFWQNLPHKVDGLSNGFVQPKYRSKQVQKWRGNATWTVALSDKFKKLPRHDGDQNKLELGPGQRLAGRTSVSECQIFCH